MMADRHAVVDEVITYIHQHIREPLTLAWLADQAAYSPYHFTRIFKEKLGISPLYYVASLRLQTAKELLLQTHLPVRDIGMEIGQQSLGTFTTRFTERVGVTPARFRRSEQQADRLLHALQQLADWPVPYRIAGQQASVEGTIRAEIPFEGVILVGLFDRPIPEGVPLYGTLLASPGSFCFTNVRPGTYYLMATSISWGTAATDVLLPHTTLRARSQEPIRVKPASAVPHQQVTLRLPHLDDPPILISLPLLMNNFLTRIHQSRNREEIA